MGGLVKMFRLNFFGRQSDTNLTPDQLTDRMIERTDGVLKENFNPRINKFPDIESQTEDSDSQERNICFFLCCSLRDCFPMTLFSFFHVFRVRHEQSLSPLHKSKNENKKTTHHGAFSI
jgi:hypothetical protein